MPRKKNKRKQIQAQKRAAEPKSKPKQVATIGHFASGSAGLALAAMTAGLVASTHLKKESSRE